MIYCEILLTNKQFLQGYIIDEEAINDSNERFLEMTVQDETVFINKDAISMIYPSEWNYEK